MLTLKRTLLGQMLLLEESITQQQLEMALADQRRINHTKRLGEILVGLRVISEATLLNALSKQLGCPIADLNSEPPDQEALQIVPSEFALRHHLLPLRQHDHTLTVAMADPLDIQSIDDLKLLTGLHIEPMIAGVTDIRRAAEQFLYLSESYHQPGARFARTVKRLLHREVLPPPDNHSSADSYPGDYEIAPIQPARMPWAPTSLVALCRN